MTSAANINRVLRRNLLADGIICPYCQAPWLDFNAENIPDPDGQSIAMIQCEECFHFFKCSSEIVFNTYADCASNRMDHDFSLAGIQDFEICSRCPATRKFNLTRKEELSKELQ